MMNDETMNNILILTCRNRKLLLTTFKMGQTGSGPFGSGAVEKGYWRSRESPCASDRG